MATTTPTQDDKLERLKQAKAYAVSKGGLCLSEEYVNAVHKMQWKCSHPEHPVWKTKINNMVKNGAWCKKCAAEKNPVTQANPDGLILAKKYAISKGGICLSEIYINGENKLIWKCHNEQHQAWTSTYSQTVNRKTWCPQCNEILFRERLNIAKKYAKEKNGACLSHLYEGSREHLVWKCHNFNHLTWKSSLDTCINKQSWCPQCATEQTALKLINPNGLELAKKYALKNNGQCLTTEYINTSSKMTWKCSNPKHLTWQSSYSVVVRGKSWCPQCAGDINITENRVRMILQTYFKVSLTSCRPDWNRNPLTNKRLELDGYNEKLKLAFEHDGEHHFKETCFGRKPNKDTFTNQLIRDEAKKQNCTNNGITLINIPIAHSKYRKNFFKLLRHVIDCCKPYGFNLIFTLHEIKEMKTKFYEV